MLAELPIVFPTQVAGGMVVGGFAGGSSPVNNVAVVSGGLVVGGLADGSAPVNVAVAAGGIGVGGLAAGITEVLGFVTNIDSVQFQVISVGGGTVSISVDPTKYKTIS